MNQSRMSRVALGRVRGLMAAVLAVLVLLPAVLALAGTGRAEKRYLDLVKQLNSPNKRKRLVAANKLADWEGHKEQSAVRIGDALIEERDKYTAKQMVKALARIGSPVAYGRMLEAMKGRAHEDVRIEIVKWTGAKAAAGAPKAVSGIWTRAGKDPAHKVQMMALTVLAKKKWAVAASHVRKAASSSKFATIRARAVYRIGLSKELSFKSFVAIYWKDSAPQVKQAVLDVVATTPSKEALDLLNRALGEKSPLVREHSLKKIRKLFSRAADGSMGSRTVTMREILLWAGKRENNAKVMRLLVNVLTGFPPSKPSEKFFIDRLRSRFPLVRIAAARALSKTRSPEAAKALGLRRTDPMPSVRQAAAEALARIGTGRAVEVLVLFISDKDKDINKAALEGLAAIGDRRAVPSMVTALQGRQKDTLRVLRTLQALGRIGGRLAAKVMAAPALLGHKEKMIRFAAARGLAEHPWPEAVGVLIERVKKEKDARVLTQLIRALSPFKTPRVMAAVSVGLNAQDVSVLKETVIALRGAPNRSLVDDLDQVFNRKGLRLELVKTLASIGGPKAATRLRKMFNEKSSHVRYAAIEGLGSCKLEGEERDRYVEILIDTFEMREGKARELQSVARALGRLGGERALRFLRNQAKRKRAAMAVRSVALAAQVWAKHEDAYKLAAKLAGDHNVFLRRAGYEALGDLGEEKGIKKLLRALKKTSGSERTAVIEALAKNGRADGVLDRLKKAWEKEEKAKRPDMLLRVALVGALARIDRSDEMAERLTELLDDELLMQRAACRALATFKYKPSIEKLIALVNGKNKVLSEEALKALEMVTNVTFGRFTSGWTEWWKKNKGLSMDQILVYGFGRHSTQYAIKGGLTNAGNVKTLINALADYEWSCRYNAVRALRAIAEKSFGYDFEPAYDAVGIAAWGAWKAGNR